MTRKMCAVPTFFSGVLVWVRTKIIYQWCLLPDTLQMHTSTQQSFVASDRHWQSDLLCPFCNVLYYCCMVMRPDSGFSSSAAREYWIDHDANIYNYVILQHQTQPPKMSPQVITRQQRLSGTVSSNCPGPPSALCNPQLALFLFDLQMKNLPSNERSLKYHRNVLSSRVCPLGPLLRTMRCLSSVSACVQLCAGA